MAEIVKAACIQMTSGPDIKQNLAEAERFIRKASNAGAKLIATPENTCQVRHPANQMLENAPTQDDHPGIPLFSSLAKELDIWILIGSMTVKTGSKLANRSFLFAPDGTIKSQYDKIHLFDVVLTTGDEYRESDIVTPGDKPVIAQTPWGGVGMTICYDVRFAYLYRRLAQQGASILSVPAAFTVPTGKAHWEILLRARAIETGSYILAPAQIGEHENGRKTWGHSMIVNPWGEIVTEKEEGTGIITANLNMAIVKRARQSIPALQHDRKI